MMVQDLITRSPATVDQTSPVADAARVMRERDVGSVVVVEDGEIVGILTDRDIVMRLAVDDEAWGSSVESVMTVVPVCVRGEVDVEQCIERMEEHGVRRVPVLSEDGALLGVVSLDDILMHIGRLLGLAGAVIRAEVAGVA